MKGLPCIVSRGGWGSFRCCLRYVWGQGLIDGGCAVACRGICAVCQVFNQIGQNQVFFAIKQKGVRGIFFALTAVMWCLCSRLIRLFHGILIRFLSHVIKILREKG